MVPCGNESVQAWLGYLIPNAGSSSTKPVASKITSETFFRQIFTELPIRENYFYRVYLKGAYCQDHCPDYLKAANYPVLRYTHDRVRTYTTTLADFLHRNPGKYSHFLLLDHQDWLAANAPEALTEEWKLILANSRPGTRILLRSATSQPETIPHFVRRRAHLHERITAAQHKLDRVGTYAGAFLLEILE